MTPGRRAVLSAVAVNLLGVLPMFLTGGMAVQIGRDFQVSPASLGALASLFALSTTLGSAPLGRQVRRLGIRRSMWLAASAATAALIVAAASSGVFMLGMAMLLGGLGNAMGQPAGNALVAAHVRPQRYGLGFAIKQSAIPLATTLAGFSVPALALTVGWRYAYVAAAVLSVAAVLLVPSDRHQIPGRSEHALPPGLVRPLWFLVAGLAVAVTAATSIGALGAAGGVQAGLSEAAAGYLIAAGGISGLALRLVAGAAADRRAFDPLKVASAMCVLGAIGWLLMATQAEAAFVVGLLVANAFGWGWAGLQHLAIARRFPTATAAASGVAQTGVAIGVLVGPALLATLAAGSWSLMWAVAAGCALLGAVIIRISADLLPA